MTRARDIANFGDGIATADIDDGAVTAAKIGSLPEGSVLQVVQTVKSDAFSTTSQTMVDVTGLSATITPSSANNKILVMLTLTTAASVTNIVTQYTQLLRDASIVGAWSVGAPADDQPGILAYNLLDSPNTTNATTYKVQTRGDGALVGVNTSQDSGSSDRGDSSITLMEIAG